MSGKFLANFIFAENVSPLVRVIHTEHYFKINLAIDIAEKCCMLCRTNFYQWLKEMNSDTYRWNSLAMWACFIFLINITTSLDNGPPIFWNVVMAFWQFLNAVLLNSANTLHFFPREQTSKKYKQSIAFWKETMITNEIAATL